MVWQGLISKPVGVTAREQRSERDKVTSPSLWEQLLPARTQARMEKEPRERRVISYLGCSSTNPRREKEDQHHRLQRRGGVSKAALRLGGDPAKRTPKLAAVFCDPDPPKY